MLYEIMYRRYAQRFQKDDTKITNNASKSIPYPVVKEANQDDDLYTAVEREATLEQLGLRKLLFIDRIGTSPSLSP